MNDEIKFEGFPKIPRLFRDVVILEKIDGTNAQVFIYQTVTSALELRAGSRNRWITPADDNFGFARWCEDHREELLTLGPGRHFGEWYGAGIQRNYGLTEKRFALFAPDKYPVETRPACCGVAPVLCRCTIDTLTIRYVLEQLRQGGSRLVPGFMQPEGIVVYHTAGRVSFKVTLENDDEPKGAQT